MRVRSQARLVAAFWLSCQAAAFAASPFVLCSDASMVSATGADHECDIAHQHHDQPAPPAESHDHHQHQAATTTPPANGAALSCKCPVSDVALAALTLDAGVLPGQVVLDTTLAASREVLPDYAPPTRIHPIDTPPPRA